MLRLLIIWVIVLVLGSAVLARKGGGLAELIITGGFFLTIPALMILWILLLFERLGSTWFPNMPFVLGIMITVVIPGICIVFYREQTGWDVILQGILPISIIFGLAWAFSPRLVS